MYKVKIKVPRMHLREKPTVKSMALGIVDKNEIFEVIEEIDDFVKTNQGWLAKLYVEPICNNDICNKKRR